MITKHWLGKTITGIRHEIGQNNGYYNKRIINYISGSLQSQSSVWRTGFSITPMVSNRPIFLSLMAACFSLKSYRNNTLSIRAHHWDKMFHFPHGLVVIMIHWVSAQGPSHTHSLTSSESLSYSQLWLVRTGVCSCWLLKVFNLLIYKDLLGGRLQDGSVGEVFVIPTQGPEIYPQSLCKVERRGQLPKAILWPV